MLLQNIRRRCGSWLFFAVALLSSLTFSAQAQTNLIVNGGFEDDTERSTTFTGWTLSGDTGQCEVDDGSDTGIAPHSGNFEAALGTSGGVGYLSQTVPTTVGVYLLSFWVNNVYVSPVEFSVSWNGQTNFETSNLNAGGWTEMEYLVSATGSDTVLQFGFNDSVARFFLDDVSVESDTVAYTAVPASGQVPLTVQFTSPANDSSGNAIVSWQWNFGAGLGTSTNQNPTYTYTNIGVYQPSLTVSNMLGVLTATGPSINVTLGTPVLTWTNPAPILYGTALSSNQLNAMANVPGTFTYTPTSGTVLNLGTNTLSVVFSASNYISVTDTVSLIVSRVITSSPTPASSIVTNGQTVVTITSPTANFLTTSSALTVTGTAGPAVPTSLEITVNTNAQTNATLGAGGEWSCNLTLVPGPNVITAQSFDTNNTGTNASFPVTRTVFYDVTAASTKIKSTVSLLTSPSGAGKISGQPNHASLEIGKVYTVKAVPAVNWVFTNWTSGTNADALTPLAGSASLDFDMSSNLVLQANFVANPFTAVAGAYNGLFSPTSGVTEESSGFVAITLPANGSGAFSAKLLLDGGSYSISGLFDLTGDATATVTRAGKTAVAVALHLNLASTNAQITGSVSEIATGGWTSELLAERASSSFSGKYTLLISPGSKGPSGYGYATLSNTAKGLANISGSLADKTAISQSVGVSKNGDIPLYVSLYAKKGSLQGWLTLSNEVIVGTNLAWIDPSVFDNTNLTALGSIYIGNFSLPSGTLIISNGGLSGPLIYSNVSIADNKLMTNGTPTNKLAGIITPATGVLTLTFQPTGAHTAITAKGVILQDSGTSTNAAGWFLDANQSGSFLLHQ